MVGCLWVLGDGKRSNLAWCFGVSNKSDVVDIVATVIPVGFKFKQVVSS